MLLARRGGDAAAASRYRERTGGNPFFLEELLRDEQERDGAAEGPPAGRPRGGRPSSRAPRRTPRARCSPSPPPSGCASISGVWPRRGTGRPASSSTRSTRPSRRGSSSAAPTIASPSRTRSWPRRSCRALPASRRARLHLRLADALEASGVASPGARRVAPPGGRAAGAGRSRSSRWSRAAAREATEALAHADAAAHLAAALAAGPPAGERPELLVALGDAHDRAGERDAARASFAEAAALARAAGDAALLSRASLGFAGLAVVVAAPDPELMRLLEEALDARPAEELGTRARLRARLAVESYYADPAAAESLSEQAVADARASGDPGALAAALNARRVALWRPAHTRSRLDVVDEMIVAAEAAGDRESVLQARNWRVVDLWELGRMDELRREIDGYERLADEVGLPHYRWYVPLWRATLAILAGRWDEGAALTAQAEALGRRAADPERAAARPRAAGLLALGASSASRRSTASGRCEQAGRSPVPEPWLAAVAYVDARAAATTARASCSTG